MASKIANVPELRGKVAENFIKKADENLLKKGTVDFTIQIKDCEKILKKAREEEVLNEIAEYFGMRVEIVKALLNKGGWRTLTKEEVEKDRSSAYEYLL